MKCDECGAPIENGRCTNCGKRFVNQPPAENVKPVSQMNLNSPVKQQQKFYQSGWFCILMLLLFFPVGLFLMWKYKKFNKVVRIVVTVILVMAVIGNMGASNDNTGEAVQYSDTSKTIEVTENENLNSTIEGVKTAEDTEAFKENEDVETKPLETEEKLPREFVSALKKAEQYGNMMHMSKNAIYNQLVSEYGEQFSQEAAQYAMDNLIMDWNANALAKAENYSDMMHMSKAAIYDQLTSEYGEQFTADEAQYAIDNIQADWNKNALEKAISYQETMDMSPNAIYDQLVSSYGEKFTPEEAKYAIDNLEK